MENISLNKIQIACILGDLDFLKKLRYKNGKHAQNFILLASINRNYNVIEMLISKGISIPEQLKCDEKFIEFFPYPDFDTVSNDIDFTNLKLVRKIVNEYEQVYNFYHGDFNEYLLDLIVIKYDVNSSVDEIKLVVPTVKFLSKRIYKNGKYPKRRHNIHILIRINLYRNVDISNLIYEKMPNYASQIDSLNVPLVVDVNLLNEKYQVDYFYEKGIFSKSTYQDLINKINLRNNVTMMKNWCVVLFIIIIFVSPIIIPSLLYYILFEKKCEK